jgi:hypothetical protein
LPVKVVPLTCDETTPKPLIPPVVLKVPRPVIVPPARVTGLAPMVNVTPELMFNTLAVPGAAPAPTVNAPVVPFKLVLLPNWTGLLVRLLIVTADVLVGTPPDQLVLVVQAFDVAPDQLSAAAWAARGNEARIAVVIRSCLRCVMT